MVESIPGSAGVLIPAVGFMEGRGRSVDAWEVDRGLDMILGDRDWVRCLGKSIGISI